MKCVCGERDIIAPFDTYADDNMVHRTKNPCYITKKTNATTDSGSSYELTKLSNKVGVVFAPINKASKNDKEKIDLSLIPYVAQQAEAKAFQVGEKKYGRYNYCKGHKASQLVAAAQRHLLAWFQGEENDPIDGQPHLGSVRACTAMLLRQMELGTMIDDRFKGNDDESSK